ncbi:hypothetical protein IMCC3135_32140 [Granulosicoccus antarcticus IMCC3135]|uniref:Uncharacterized protein n=1 Tax=Granulosicoccus antarcticus IMCC3135 TaxID=1192854 RepID=A0A2Z2P9A6_9GAMM|nr:hypothetical protein IMCC3135_32140 [Granulosicoccus antarcticus IMCC3135]
MKQSTISCADISIRTSLQNLPGRYKVFVEIDPDYAYMRTSMDRDAMCAFASAIVYSPK